MSCAQSGAAQADLVVDFGDLARGARLYAGIP